MGYKDEKKMEEFKHECKLTQLAFKRETLMMLEELKWKLSYMKYQQQQQYYQQPQQMVAPEYVPTQKDAVMENESAKKYGGKKNG